MRDVTKRMVGMEILPGVIFHAVTDVSPETIEAMKKLAEIVRDLPDKDLKDIENYANYLGSSRKRKSKKP